MGTAPGLATPCGAAWIYSLPGVPAEMRAMVLDSVLPRLREADLPQRGATSLLRTVGRPESQLAQELDPLGETLGVVLGWYPHQGEVDVVVAGEEGARLAFLEQARARLGLAALGEVPGDASGGGIAPATVRALRERGWSLATAESLTGGAVAAALTSVPGASAVFVSGWICYATESKTRHLGVEADLIAREGVVSEAVARAMAAGAHAKSGAAIAVAVTGVAGPASVSGPEGSVAVGTVHIATHTPTGPGTHASLHRSAPRAIVCRRTTVAALDLVRRAALCG